MRPALFLPLAMALGSFVLPLYVGAAEPAQTPALPADGPALLREWAPPVYPPAALKTKQGGFVSVRVVVDAQGQPEKVRALEDSDEAFIEAALAAVKQWRFAPAVERGQAVPCCLDTLVTFSPAQGQRKRQAGDVPPADQTFNLSPRTPPRARVTPEMPYPDSLAERQLTGKVQFACQVTTEGRARAPRVLAATHADFVLPALEALRHWEFDPAMQGDLPVEAGVEARIAFEPLVGRSAEVLAANGITGLDGGEPSPSPKPVMASDPVWPVERLLAGETGTADVEFTVTESGQVREVRVSAASHPDFGYALAAAMERWAFEPPLQDGRGQSVRLRRHVAFELSGSEQDPVGRLAAALRADAISGAKGLDERLMPVYQVAPRYPWSLRQDPVAGQAQIEAIVDRTGRVRLPRVVTATHEAFGWAAATAVAEWVFRAPRRAGEPVDVKVRIPFNFMPPADQG